MLVWKNVTDNNPSRVVTEHEYMAAYCRDISACPGVWKSAELAVKTKMLEKEAELLALQLTSDGLQAKYTEWFRATKDQLAPLDNYKFMDHGGIYAGSRSVHNPGKEGYRYDVLHPATGRPCKQPLMGYRFPQETMNDLLNQGRIIFGEDETKLVELKSYLQDYKQKLASVMDLDGRAGPNELRFIFNESPKVFNNPKPLQLISEVLSFVTSGEDIVLDFFAGSGTTAHAVAKLNAEDGGERRFILVSSTEATVDAPKKNLCRDVCAERVRRVLGGYRNAKGESVTGLGDGFAYLRARRIAAHRLSQKLDHAEVWVALQMLHERPLTPWPGHGFAADGALAYLADFREAHIEHLRDWLERIDGAAATIYCWAPERVSDLAPTANWQPIPQTLRERFGR